VSCCDCKSEEKLTEGQLRVELFLPISDLDSLSSSESILKIKLRLHNRRSCKLKTKPKILGQRGNSFPIECSRRFCAEGTTRGAYKNYFAECKVGAGYPYIVWHLRMQVPLGLALPVFHPGPSQVGQSKAMSQRSSEPPRCGKMSTHIVPRPGDYSARNLDII
jgi:hypothetical protein